jgi:hypothetical protein
MGAAAALELMILRDTATDWGEPVAFAAVTMIVPFEAPLPAGVLPRLMETVKRPFPAPDVGETVIQGWLAAAVHVVLVADSPVKFTRTS